MTHSCVQKARTAGGRRAKGRPRVRTAKIAHRTQRQDVNRHYTHLQATSSDDRRPSWSDPQDALPSPPRSRRQTGCRAPRRRISAVTLRRVRNGAAEVFLGSLDQYAAAYPTLQGPARAELDHRGAYCSHQRHKAITPRRRPRVPAKDDEQSRGQPVQRHSMARRPQRRRIPTQASAFAIAWREQRLFARCRAGGMHTLSRRSFAPPLRTDVSPSSVGASLAPVAVRGAGKRARAQFAYGALCRAPGVRERARGGRLGRGHVSDGRALFAAVVGPRCRLSSKRTAGAQRSVS